MEVFDVLSSAPRRLKAYYFTLVWLVTLKFWQTSKLHKFAFRGQLTRLYYLVWTVSDSVNSTLQFRHCFCNIRSTDFEKIDSVGNGYGSGSFPFVQSTRSAPWPRKWGPIWLAVVAWTHQENDWIWIVWKLLKLSPSKIYQTADSGDVSVATESGFSYFRLTANRDTLWMLTTQ